MAAIVHLRRADHADFVRGKPRPDAEPLQPRDAVVRERDLAAIVLRCRQGAARLRIEHDDREAGLPE